LSHGGFYHDVLAEDLEHETDQDRLEREAFEKAARQRHAVLEKQYEEEDAADEEERRRDEEISRQARMKAKQEADAARANLLSMKNPAGRSWGRTRLPKKPYVRQRDLF
jgi:hypothetical protein